jgi:signal transduction histidine kinase
VVTGFAIWGTTHYVGPFVYDSATRSVLETQLFIAIAAGSTLALAALMSERTRMARRLRASRVRLVEAADSERRRLERNLHDGAQQRLVALTNRLAAAGAEVHDAPESAQRAIVAVRDELQLAIDELRELAHGLHPPVLRDLGLAGAIQTLALRTTVPIEVVAVPRERLDETTEATAYYVVLEAVANAERQGAAVALELRVDRRRGRLRIVVSDDGGGGAVERPGSGLQGLHDRVEALGGRFDLDSPLGGGTRVEADIPVRPGRPASGRPGPWITRGRSGRGS